MTKTLLMVIPQKTQTETCEIPTTAWFPIQRIVRDEFHGDMTLHDHGAAGRFHDFPWLPGPHCVVEVTVDAAQVKDLLDAIQPLIEQIVHRHTREVAVPAES